MRPKVGQWLAIIIWLIIVTGVSGGLIWLIAWQRAFPGRVPYLGAYYGYLEGTIIPLTFSTVGGVVALRRPWHRIGWLFLTIGMLNLVQLLSGYYAVAGLARPDGWAPMTDVAAWISTAAKFITVILVAMLLFLFPSGKVPAGYAQLLFWLMLGGFAMAGLGVELRPGPFDDFPSINNLFGLAALARALSVLTAIGAVVVLISLVGASVLLLVRLRRAQGIERQQLKWFVYSATMGVIFLAGISQAFPQQTNGLVGDLIWTAGIASLAVATAVAILRHGLFDIDVIIRRTLVYAVLTGALALAYFGSIVSLQSLSRVLLGSAGQSQLAIVISTLVIAALFVPVRARVQTWIDRRFYRRKYDATQTMREFAARLREETDIAALSDGLAAVVDDTLQPAHISLWLRDQDSRRA